VTLIRLYAEALDDDPGASEEDRRGFYQIILRESERLTRLVERVVGFSRAERGATAWKMAPARLDAVLASALDTYGPYLGRRGFECRVEMSPDHAR
jgi:signal transduction histidine kinase